MYSYACKGGGGDCGSEPSYRLGIEKCGAERRISRTPHAPLTSFFSSFLIRRF